TQYMPASARVLLFSLWVVSSITIVHAQESQSNPENRAADLKPLVVGADTKSNSVIAVPPVMSQSIVPSGERAARADVVDLNKWFDRETSLNGLQSMDVR